MQVYRLMGRIASAGWIGDQLVYTLGVTAQEDTEILGNMGGGVGGVEGIVSRKDGDVGRCGGCGRVVAAYFSTIRK
jgi:hypothetical protein